MFWLLTLTLLSILSIVAPQNPFFNQEYRRWTRDNSGRPCVTPKNEEGTCLEIKRCPVLLDLLLNSRTKPGVIEFLRSSRCNDTGSSSVVCCAKQTQAPKHSENNNNHHSYSNLLSCPDCGRTFVSQQTRIVGGAPAELGAWPWIALLGYTSNRRPGPTWQCGGSLISNKHVLTAAHCINPPYKLYKLYVVRLGESEIDNPNDGASPQDIMVERAIAHPNYDGEKKFYDIGIVILQRLVEFTRFIQPICLPIHEPYRSSEFLRYVPFVAGWGSISQGGPSSKKLLEAQVPMVTRESCAQSYSRKGASIIDSQICAGYATGGKDACQGDSGGPLMVPDNRTCFMQIGIVSYGFGCAKPDYPGVYTRVASHLGWVDKMISP